MLTAGTRGASEAGVNTLALQGAYFAATGVWSLVHIDSFQRVTGPKTDLWLVKTVGALVGVIGGALMAAAVRGRQTDEVRALAMGSAAALAAIDVTYVAKRRISPIYLADAVAELVLMAALMQESRRPARP